MNIWLLYKRWRCCSKNARWIVSGVAVMALVVLAGISLDRLYPVPLDKIHNLSTEIYSDDGVLLRSYLSQDQQWRFHVDVHEVSPHFLKLLIAFEDQRFFDHWGVDLWAMGRATLQNIRNQRIVSGGSTLTMQVARLLNPQSRTLRAKIQECLRAWQLEWHFDKNQILSMYLTLAPYGQNIQGIKGASRVYFQKEPKDLTWAESAWLVAVPQSPYKMTSQWDPGYHRMVRQKILDRALSQNVIEKQHHQEATEEPLPTPPSLSHNRSKILTHPISAHHLSDRVRLSKTGHSSIKTWIHSGLQRDLEHWLMAHHATLPPQTSTAVLVMEHETGRVRAYAGSMNYWHQSSQGQVDMVRAIRSPGSTLKPFVYGVGFDDLAIHPKTMIMDTPTRFGDYSPSNFGHHFFGQVTMAQALQFSLNVPAVKVFEHIGPGRFTDKIRQSGIHLHLPERDQTPGLAIVLGGVGMTLEDLVRLYSAIPQSGWVPNMQLIQGAESTDKKRVLQDLSVWYLHQILSNNVVPDGQIPGQFKTTPTRLAYKTGTSYGFRDAWAIGYNAKYTIGVWVGRADGTPIPEQFGYNTAAPILFAIENLLDVKTELRLSKPNHVIDVYHSKDLPLHWVNFDDHGDAKSQTLKLTFPTDQATMIVPDHSTIAVTVEGGTPPYFWYYDGHFLAKTQDRQYRWSPEGVGFFRISVVDQAGQTDKIQVRLICDDPS